MVSVAQTLQTALSMHQSGAFAQAEELYREIVRHNPHHADALHLLGVAAHQQNRHRSAVEFMTRAIDAQPSAVYYSNLGSAFRALGERDNAIESLRSAVRIDNDMADAHYNLGTLLQDAGKPDDAIFCLRRALEIRPAFPDAWNNLGILRHAQGRQGDAIDCYRKALELNPQLAAAHNNLGTALAAGGKPEEAVRSYRRAVEINPAYAEAHFNLGNVHRELDELGEAEACYRKTLQIDARHVAALVNLGLIHQDRAELDAAINCNHRAIEIDANHVEAHVNRSFVKRLKGEFREGFAEFEWRWKEENIQSRFGGPVWDGSSLSGKSILIYAEQGVGDEIMFASCVPDVVSRTARCFVECDHRLIPLFARSFPRAELIPRWNGDASIPPCQTPRYDVRVAAGSLLQYLRFDQMSFPRRASYLLPDATLKEMWQSRYDDLGAGLKVGISWRGGKRVQTRRKRSTSAEEWHSILSVGGVQFVNLQYGDCSKELAAFQRVSGATVHHWADSDPLSNLDAFAAQIAALDLVISIDNSTVHMAGALGVPVWNMIPFSPDWRWQMQRGDTLWYSNMRLFRQASRGDWSGVFAAVAAQLHRATHEMSASPTSWSARS